MNIKRLVLVLITALCSACLPSTLIEKIANDAKEQIAQDYIQLLVKGDLSTLAAELDPSLRNGSELKALAEARSYLPQEIPTVTNLVGYQSNHFNNQPTQYNLTYQFGYGSQWVLAQVAWREMPDGTRQIIGLHVQPLPKSLQEINAFTFRDAGLLRYGFLAGTILVPVFILATLVVCIRTKMQRRKWLWIIFVLVGLTKFSLNWTTGEWSFALLQLQVPGASAMAASIYAPWIISFSVPVGALVFWLKRKELAAQTAAPSPAPASSLNSP